MPWTWTCCGQTSGSFRNYRKYIRSWRNHCRWYHWGDISTFSAGFTRVLWMEKNRRWMPAPPP